MPQDPRMKAKADLMIDMNSKILDHRKVLDMSMNAILENLEYSNKPLIALNLTDESLINDKK